MYTHEQGSPLALEEATKYIQDGIFLSGMDVKEAVFKAQEESDRLTADFIKEVGKENFHVAEREYRHADQITFGECLM